MATEPGKQCVDGEPISLTTVNGIFPYTQAAREIGQAQGWPESATATLTARMLEAMTSRPPVLQTRGRLTGLPNTTPSDIVLHLVHHDDVNEWLESQGLDYRWSAPVAQPTDPERRLARLRTLGGTSTYQNREWRIKGIAKLVAIEKEAGRSRCDEKTIRADLKNASQSERDAKTAGFSAGLGQR